MNLEEIKEIIEQGSGKVIIVENGEPTLIVERFEDYKKNFKKSKDIIRNPGPEAPAASKTAENIPSEEFTEEVLSESESELESGDKIPPAEEELPGAISSGEEISSTEEIPLEGEIPEELGIEDLPL